MGAWGLTLPLNYPQTTLKLLSNYPQTTFKLGPDTSSDTRSAWDADGRQDGSVAAGVVDHILYN